MTPDFSVPQEPIENVFERLAGILRPTPGTLSTTPEEIQDIPGYMAAMDKTKLPHVYSGDLWFPNVYLARLHFLATNLDVEGCEMEWLAKLIQDTILGVMFFRFERVKPSNDGKEVQS